MAQLAQIEEAASIVAPCFDAVRDVFCSYVPAKGHDLILLRRTQLLIDDSIHDSDRHFARCRDDGRQIELATEAADLPLETLASIIAHEFGHAADFSYPACFRLVDKYSPAQWKVPSESSAADKVAAWQQRGIDQQEWTADAISHLVTGKRIGYCGPCMVQCFGGPSRPRGLR